MKEYVSFKKVYFHPVSKSFDWIRTVEDRVEDTWLRILLSGLGKFSNRMDFAYAGTLE